LFGQAAGADRPDCKTCLVSGYKLVKFEYASPAKILHTPQGSMYTFIL